MDIHTEFVWDIEKFTWHDATISDHDKIIDIESTKCLGKLGIIFDFFWLKNRNIIFESDRFYRSFCELLVSSDRLIWLRYDETNIEVSIPEK